MAPPRLTGLGELLTCEMGRDEEEGRAEESEADAQSTLGFDLRHNAGSHSGVFHLWGKIKGGQDGTRPNSWGVFSLFPCLAQSFRG